MDQIGKFTQALFALVEQDRLQESLDALRAYYQLTASEDEMAVILLKGRLSNWENEQREGLKPDPVERRRIAHSITEIGKRLAETDPELSQEQLAAITPTVSMPVAVRSKNGQYLLVGLASIAFFFGLQYLGHWLTQKQEIREASLNTFDVVILPFGSYANDGGGRLAVEKALLDRMKAVGDQNKLPLTVRYREVKTSLTDPLDAAKARRIGLRQLADLVIWGDYEKQVGWDSTLFNFRYVNLDSAVYQAPFGEKGETGFQRASSLAALNAGTITGRIEDMVYWAFGMRAYMTGEYEQAIHLLNKVQDREDRAFADVFFFRAYTYSELGKKDSALHYYNRALALNPEDPDSYNNRGNLFLDKLQSDSAIADYEKAIQLNEKEPIFWRNKGIALQGLGQHAAAMAHFNRAIELNPDLGASYRIRGALYAVLDSTERALNDFDKALALGYEDALLYFLRGNIRINEKAYESALADNIRAVALDSTAEHLNGRANAYRLLGEYERALDDLAAAIELDSTYFLAYGTRAEVYAHQGKTEAFYREITRALEKGCPVWAYSHDPVYDPYRDTPRFQALLKRYQSGT